MATLTILTMQVALYPGHTPTGEPQWTGPLEDLWKANQESFTFGDMREIAENLRHGVNHYVGGGAEAAFTITRPRPHA